MLRVNLGKTENLGICQRTTVLLFNLMQVFNLLRAKSKTFLLVVFFQIVYVLDRLWLDVHREDVLVQTVVHTLQHGVVVGIL